jgi:hypothetical protein
VQPDLCRGPSIGGRSSGHRRASRLVCCGGETDKARWLTNVGMNDVCMCVPLHSALSVSCASLLCCSPLACVFPLLVRPAAVRCAVSEQPIPSQ